MRSPASPASPPRWSSARSPKASPQTAQSSFPTGWTSTSTTRSPRSHRQRLPPRTRAPCLRRQRKDHPPLLRQHGCQAGPRTPRPAGRILRSRRLPPDPASTSSSAATEPSARSSNPSSPTTPTSPSFPFNRSTVSTTSSTPPTSTSFLSAPAADLVMPSRLTAMLSSGRPIIATADPGTQVARHRRRNARPALRTPAASPFQPTPSPDALTPPPHSSSRMAPCAPPRRRRPRLRCPPSRQRTSSRTIRARSPPALFATSITPNVAEPTGTNHIWIVVQTSAATKIETRRTEKAASNSNQMNTLQLTHLQ